MDKETIVNLNSRHSCTLDFLTRFLQEVETNVPCVPEDGLFTAQVISGEDYWDPLSDYEKSVSGSCMEFSAKHGLVPFENVPRKGRDPYPLQYRRKASWKP